jgi:hypothetical protein
MSLQSAAAGDQHGSSSSLGMARSALLPLPPGSLQ